ncbi:hypothetical protein GCM10009756_27810 [Pseudokineococcus marinus]
MRERLDAVLARRAGADEGAGARPDPDDQEPADLDPDDLDPDDLDPDDLDREPGTGGGRRRRAPAGRRSREAGLARTAGPGWSPAEQPDLVEGLGLWPHLRAALADRVPASLRGARWTVPLPAVTATLLVVAVVLVAIAVRSSATAPGLPVPVRAQATAASASASPSASSPSALSASSAPSAPAAALSTPAAPAQPSSGPPTGVPPDELVVHVVGRVVAPGVVRLPAGARVVDALEAAGGATPEADLAQVNLARPVVDGEQVHVPAPGEEPPVPAGPPAGPASGAGAPGGAAGAGAPADPGSGPEGGPLDLNRAALADLDALPGIGPVLAQRILDTREQLGAFTSVEELGEVSGIGEARLAELRELVVV